MARRLVETALQEWLAGLFDEESAHPAEVIFTDPHAPEPTPPFVRLSVKPDKIVGGAETDMDSVTECRKTVQHKEYDVIVECVGDIARELADTITSKYPLDASTVADAGASMQECYKLNADHVLIGNRMEYREWLQMRVSCREEFVESVKTLGGVNIVNPAGTADELSLDFEVMAGD